MLTKADEGCRGSKPNADHCWRRGEGARVQEPLILADVICEQPLSLLGLLGLMGLVGLLDKKEIHETHET